MVKAELPLIADAKLKWARFKESAAHHLDAWRTAWARDKADTAPRRSRADAEFLPAALEIMETPPSPLGRAVLWAIMAFFAITVAWAVFAKVNINATASGKLIPAGRVKLIQPLEAGTVSAILVKEGQKVHEGDLLIELDATEIEAAREQVEHEMLVAEIERARWRAALDNPANPVAVFDPPHDLDAAKRKTYTHLLRSQSDAFQDHLLAIDDQIKAARARLASVRDNLERMRQTAPLVRREYVAKKTLVDKGVAAPLSLVPLQRQMIDFKKGISGERRKVTETQATIAAAREQRKEAVSNYQNNALSQFTLADRRIDNFKQELVKLERRRTRQALISPVDGVVQQLKTNTIGGVVTPAEVLMVIVPDTHRLEADVMIPNRDIGFVEKGQKAVVKLETFLFTRYGAINGRVRTISSDAVADKRLGLAYPARITLDRTSMTVDGREVQLTPGMAATVEVTTGRRRVIAFVLAPLLRYAKESFHER
ncbi:HlyD family type I secretion periplasmic adaptor subunit [Varunaivibrio sulfuroxidans]|uniref:Membrane fusion protein (MFP) family protein n=1 Tax=Varunaivibrio sulfuroxidans TaxID=1773489 RepID=A0A4R3JCY9_9PROT|nr:HlyD family type I secretion periplasmic adaptor subunit [Varunaivibrio sulfuroxidans]TCS63056.1 hemolysin D [Varunaivibrio sulfuroxidans]WES31872.1 HlyD family type I secretion periplasmic adaptor subunit [Varunaivibrio sulfuroxidans]